MLFVTNRTPVQSARSRTNRNISFDYQNTAVSQYLYFCERNGANDYTEIKSKAFFKRLKGLPEKVQLLLYVHGFNNNMEPDVFSNAQSLQALMDAQSPGLVHVVPLFGPATMMPPSHLPMTTGTIRTPPMPAVWRLHACWVNSTIGAATKPSRRNPVCAA